MALDTPTGSEEQLRLAIAMALLRSKILKKPSDTPSATLNSNALRWKHKAHFSNFSLFKTHRSVIDSKRKSVKKRFLDSNTISKKLKTFKRRNGGSNKHGRGHVKFIWCSNCDKWRNMIVVYCCGERFLEILVNQLELAQENSSYKESI